MRYFLILAVLLMGCNTTTNTPIAPNPNPSIENLMLSSINTARALSRQCGGVNYPAVLALAWNAKLETAGKTHNQDMISNNYFDHTSPTGSTPATRATSAGYVYSIIGENIAYGYPTLEAVMTGWLKSPGHCKNIMGASYTEVGLAQTNSNSNKGIFWTMVLAKPRP